MPPSDNPDFDPEEDDPTLEASWPHLTVRTISLLFTHFGGCLRLFEIGDVFLVLRAALSIETINESSYYLCRNPKFFLQQPLFSISCVTWCLATPEYIDTSAQM